jgi:hypothetical protein
LSKKKGERENDAIDLCTSRQRGVNPDDWPLQRPLGPALFSRSTHRFDLNGLPWCRRSWQFEFFSVCAPACKAAPSVPYYWDSMEAFSWPCFVFHPKQSRPSFRRYPRGTYYSFKKKEGHIITLQESAHYL